MLNLPIIIISKSQSMKKLCIRILFILLIVSPLMAVPGQETPREVARSLHERVRAGTKQVCSKIGYPSNAKKLAIAGGTLLLVAVGSALYVYAKSLQEHNGHDQDSNADYLSKSLVTSEDVQNLLTRIHGGLNNVHGVVIDALENDHVDETVLNANISDLMHDKVGLSEFRGFNPELMAQLQDPNIKTPLKESADVIAQTYRTLFDEAGALDLWLKGYDEYVSDLEDNFKNLPNEVVQKPDFKELYEALGFLNAEAGKEASFTSVQESYKRRSGDLRGQLLAKLREQQTEDESTEIFEKCVQDEFASKYFNPYLRVLGLVFRTSHHKKQYEAFLAGKAAYNAKADALSAHMPAIKNLFERDLPELVTIPGSLQEHFS
jgi:hypothetical protein